MSLTFFFFFHFGYNVAIFSNLSQGYLHQMLTKLQDSKAYSTQFFMYFQPMITISTKKYNLTMLKFGLMLITTLALRISISHNIFSVPSCSEFQTVLFYNRNHMIWSSFEQDTVKKPTFPYFWWSLVHLLVCIVACLLTCPLCYFQYYHGLQHKIE